MKNDKEMRLTGKSDVYKKYSPILSDMEIKKYSIILGQIDVSNIFETVYTVMKDIEIIQKYNKIVHNLNTLELQDIHYLLENNIWLINDRYRIYSSNISLKKIIEKDMQKRFKSKERKRPDIICKNNFDDYIIVELKSPKHKIVSLDFSQLLEYITIIEAHCPNSKLIKGYLIGLKFDESIRSKRLERTGIYLLSYNEILTDVKFRYRRSIETLKVEGLL